MAIPAVKIAVDIILWVFVTIPFAVLELGSTPDTAYQRGFYCDDESIRYPYKEDTISDAVLIVVGLAPTIIAIFIIEWFLYKQCHGHKNHFEPVYRRKEVGSRSFHPYIVALYCTLGPFAFGVSVVGLLTDGAKFLIGRLRPHFVSVCEPDWSQFNCTDEYGEPLYVQNIPCLGTNEDKLLDARLSFPSGHASFSCFCFVYLAIYLQCRMVWTFSLLLRPFLQLLGLTFALMCGLSRVSDYKHHPHDVLAGSVLGSGIAILVACVVSDLVRNKVAKITKASTNHSDPAITNGSNFTNVSATSLKSSTHSISVEPDTV